MAPSRRWCTPCSEALILVVLVVILFLQTWRASIIPLVAVPVSLIGTFAVMHLFGFSLNALSLFGLVLAIGIVVDDAIVVVENVERNIELGLTPVEATKRAMGEVTGPIIATALVLCAVFVPAAFISGLTGQFYKQFALTIAISTVISAVNTLTLSPALAAVLLKGRDGSPRTVSPSSSTSSSVAGCLRPFNRFFERASHGLRGHRRPSDSWQRHRPGALCGPDGVDLLRSCFHSPSTGFVPGQDKQYLVAFAQLPDAVSLDRTEDVIKRMSDLALKQPGVESAVAFPGLSINGFTNSPNAGIVFVTLKPFDERKDPSMSAGAIAGALNDQYAGIQEAYMAIFPPPPVQGLGTIGGFRLQIEDRGNLGYDELYKETMNIITKSRSVPELAGLFTSYTVNVPQVDAAIDREKAKTHGVAVERHLRHPADLPGFAVCQRLQPLRPYLPGQRPGRAAVPSRVGPDRPAQGAQQPWRDDPAGDLHQGQRHLEGPDRVMHYNGFITAEINGAAAPGYPAPARLKKPSRNCSRTNCPTA